MLHGLAGFDAGRRWLDALSAETHVAAVRLPGFGGPPIPYWFDSIDDLVLAIDELATVFAEERQIILVGLSLGGWVAAELAVRRPSWLGRLVLVNAVGAKFGAPDQREIADLWAHSPAQLADLMFHDSEIGLAHFRFAERDVEDLRVVAQSDEAVVRYAWEPYMHNPKLRARLVRIDVPTRVLWGANDQFVSPEYGRALTAAIPHARFEVIGGAGHMPDIEQPDQLAALVSEFVRLPG